MNPIFQSQQMNNPMEMIKQMAMQNPSYAPIVQMLNNGTNPEIVFRNLCAQRGVNPDQFLAGLNKR